MKTKILVPLFFFLAFYSYSQDTKIPEELAYLINNRISSLDILDSIYYKKKQSKDQIELLIKKSKEASYLEGLLFGYNSLGRYYRGRSLFDKSTTAYKKAIKLSIELKDTISEVRNLNAIGTVYRRQDYVKKALNYHQEALNKALMIKKPNNRVKKSISVSQNSMGNIYVTLKQYRLALNEFKKSIKTQKELNNLLGLAINYQNIGKANQKLGNLDEAMKNFSESLKYNNILKSKVGKIICGYSISNVLIEQKKYKQALKTVDTVVQMAIEKNDKYYLSKTYNTLGLAQFYLNKNSKAKKNLNTALSIALEYNIQAIIVEANLNLALIYEKEKNYKKAFVYYKKAKEGDAKTFNERNLVYVSQLIATYNKERSDNKIKQLARKNEMTQLLVTRNRNLWIISICIFVLITIVIFSINKQRRLRNEKRILSLKQDALRSQMNPHFMFNALNSIKLFIIENNKRKAISFLNKFSKLMRKILDASSIQETTLFEEIETMKLYMGIENIRFSNEIDFAIKTDASLNLTTIKIPPLALQPFLENSIWHGLSPKKGVKKINVSIERISSKYIQIIIKDNGIGRESSAKIKAEKSINRKSVGINLTRMRLTNFAKSLKNDYTIVYNDLKDKDNIALGTEVIIQIPLF
ncbi:tetratricopeptide repeat protein [Polaribacter sp. Z014]|uniref:tetratricopeptide repeat-containing sensor histidine kinase n=1 Tax=Polaribacter sp. Z014 TaxID=2927126 RepID=UPI00202227D2|nr:histidine kinase [Polaribacter sp. Z014]MCL7762246.1 tetratricopeptide repeat protein [Polaribacter sp. Z014]